MADLRSAAQAVLDAIDADAVPEDGGFDQYEYAVGLLRDALDAAQPADPWAEADEFDRQHPEAAQPAGLTFIAGDNDIDCARCNEWRYSHLCPAPPLDAAPPAGLDPGAPHKAYCNGSEPSDCDCHCHRIPGYLRSDAPPAGLREALVEAVLPLEVIAAQDRAKPYAELSRDLIADINAAISTVRAALDPWPAALADPAFVAAMEEGMADFAAGRVAPFRHRAAPSCGHPIDAERLAADALYLAEAAHHLLDHLSAEHPEFSCEDLDNVRHFSRKIEAVAYAGEEKP